MEPKGIAAASQPQWISIEDRLPEMFQPVIVCRDGSKVEQGFRGCKQLVEGIWNQNQASHPLDAFAPAAQGDST